jgi:hypothetical protein
MDVPDCRHAWTFASDASHGAEEALVLGLGCLPSELPDTMRSLAPRPISTKFATASALRHETFKNCGG